MPGIPISPALDGNPLTLSHAGDIASQPAYGVAPETEDLTIDIIRSPLEIGPEMIAFKVVGWSGWDTADPANDTDFDRRRVDIDFYWNFDDPGSSFRTNLNVHAVWQNANIAHGPEVSHTFDPTGTGSKTYDVTVWAVEVSSGKTLEKTISVTVKDPLAEFSGSDFILVDDENIHANAASYPGAATTTTLAGAYNIADGRSTPSCIVLREGRTFPTDGNRMRSSVGVPRWANLYITTDFNYTSRATVAWQAGDRSRVWEVDDDIMDGWAADKKAFQFVGLDVTGPWDELTETSSVAVDVVGWHVEPAVTEHIYAMWHDCTFNGFYTNVDMNGEYFAGLSNCDITNWRDYGIYGVYRNFVVLGTHIARNVNALAGGIKANIHNRHGCIRTANPSGPGKEYCQIIDACYLYNHAGWIDNAGRQTPQPPFRFNQSGVAGARLNMQRTTIIGGFHCVEFDRASSGETPRIQNILMDRIHLVPFAGTRYGIECQSSGVVGRNITMVKDTGAPLTGTHAFRALVGTDRTDAEDKDAANTAGPVEFSNCTIVGLLGQTEEIIHSSMDDRTALISENHIEHYPNATPAVTTHAPLDATGTDITNGYPGYQSSTETLDTANAIGGAFGATYAPQAGSSALNAAASATAGSAPYRDAAGTIRDNSPNLGAW